MDCVNHSGVTATAFCQNCGKALCPNCVRNGAGGQILCEPCWVAWQNVPNPFMAPPVGGPNPSAREHMRRTLAREQKGLDDGIHVIVHGEEPRERDAPLP